MSKEFIDLRIFHGDCNVLMNPDFWNVLFVMCHALYAPMRVLRLGDQKVPAMDKLYYFVHQTDATLPKYLNIAEDDCSGLVEMDQTLATLRTMSMTASDKYETSPTMREVILTAATMIAWAHSQLLMMMKILLAQWTMTMTKRMVVNTNPIVHLPPLSLAQRHQKIGVGKYIFLMQFIVGSQFCNHLTNVLLLS